MIKETYVSFEIAKLLKEKGFNEPTTHWYNIKENLISDYAVSYKNFTSPVNVWLAPTLQMACAWLRERGYHIFSLYQRKYKTWGRIIQELSTGIEWSIGGFDSHDRAVENAIIYTLENLI